MTMSGNGKGRLHPHAALLNDSGFKETGIGAFERANTKWFREIEQAQAAYALPPQTTEYLRISGTLPEAAVRLEQAFWSICAQSNAHGVFAGVPFSSPFLSERLPLPLSGQLASIGLSEDQIAAILEAERKAASTHERLKGYLGWLLTEPVFLQERDQLRDSWVGLPEKLPGELRLAASVTLGQPMPDSAPVDDQVRRFQTSLDAFLRKWSLVQLTTWDLPLPQGPQIPSPLPSNSPASNFDAIWAAIPLHYPLRNDDGFLDAVQSEQLALAEIKGIDRSAAGLSHHGRYATMFAVQHWERVLSHRLALHKTKGAVTIIIAALATQLGISEDEIRKLRKMISLCRRGRRQEVKELQEPKTRRKAGP
jgi:hypothetical protein